MMLNYRDIHRLCWLAMCAACIALLAACGGGGDGTPVSITTQPADQTAEVGTEATFIVQAKGEGLAYDWQVSNDGGATWTDVAGGTAASLAVAVTDVGMTGAQYRVLVHGTIGAVTSSIATLTATKAPLKITSQPQSITVAIGATAAFSVRATGSDLAYQWQASTDGGKTYVAVVGATKATYTTPVTTLQDNGMRFEVTVSDGVDHLVSDSATLGVAALAAPVITTQPIDVTVSAPATATFKVVASGSPTLTYQWQVSTDAGKTYADVAGATAASYTTPATTTGDTGKMFRVEVANAEGHVISNPAKLTVLAGASPPPTSPPASSQCIDASILKAGYSIHVVYGFSSNSALSLTIDGQSNGLVDFQGVKAQELEVTSDTVEPGLTTKVVVKTYANIDPDTYVVTNYGSTETGTTVGGGVTTTADATSEYSPPWVDRSFTLAPSQTIVQSPATSVTNGASIINGVPQPPSTKTYTTQDTVTFIGIESVTVPAGTFQACRYQHSSVSVPSTGVASVSTAWLRVGDGIEVKAVDPGNITMFAQSISPHAAP